MATVGAAVPLQHADEAWALQPPSLSDIEIVIIQDPPPPEPPQDPSWLLAGPGDKAAAERGPAWVTYAFFFGHLATLDRVAAAEAALGNETDAASWRDHEGLAAGLEPQEAAWMKEVAYDCNAALAAKDEEIRAVVAAYRAEDAGKAPAVRALPPRLYSLWDERVQIVEQSVYQLRALLGEERFLALDSYVRATFVPVTVPAGSAAVKGESR